MSDMANADKPAFAIPDNGFDWQSLDATGLTKREYFAGLAMAALLTGIFAHDLMVDKVGDFIDSEGIKIRDFIKIKSYDMADIMLKEESDQP